MAELSFLSLEVENDSDNPDHCENITYRGCQTDVTNSEFNSSINGNADNRRTVEICQKTVNPDNRVKSENFNILRVIGKGAYGKVFLVEKVDSSDKGKYYAMKVLKKARLVCSEKDKAHTTSERNILEMLKHPFIVRLHYAFQSKSNLYIVLEYCPGGELFNHLEKEGCLLENAACFYTAEIALAIGHLHSLGIIYRDLKSENVLLDRQGHVKLTDFGLSKEGVCTTNTFCGTIEYMAPEIIRCEGHGKAVDWWSLGTLLFDMLSGGPPFSHQKSSEATTRDILTAPLKIPLSFSLEASQLIRGLLKKDPRERLGSRGDVEEIKRHKFFRRYEINWSDVYHRRLLPPFKPKLSCDSDVSMFDPHFTNLQPVVSPADCSKLIPPDMFQGFSYVAPGVCENETDDTWPEPVPSDSQWRRHFGTRGAASAGRLQRLDVAPAAYGVQTPLQSGPAHSRPAIRVCKVGAPEQVTATVSQQQESSSFGMPTVSCADTLNMSRQQQDIPSKVSTQLTVPGNSDKHQLCSESVYRKDVPQVNPCFKKPSSDDEDGSGNNEDDDEIEDENVPGAKQICAFKGHSSYAYITQPVASSTFSSHVGAKNEDRIPVPPSLLSSKSMPHSMSSTSHKISKKHLTASPFSYNSVGTAASNKRTPTDNGRTLMTSNSRKGVMSQLTSSRGSPSVGNTDSTTSTSGSKCTII